MAPVMASPIGSREPTAPICFREWMATTVFSGSLVRTFLMVASVLTGSKADRVTTFISPMRGMPSSRPWVRATTPPMRRSATSWRPVQPLEVLATIDNTATTAINLTGNELDNYLVGNAGANTLDGGGGVDQLWGREGDDSYFVDAAMSSSNMPATATTSSTPAPASRSGAGMAVEVLGTVDNTATTAINLIGNELANYLVGNAGANMLDGGGGFDQLWGRDGDDSYFADGKRCRRRICRRRLRHRLCEEQLRSGAGMAIEVLGTVDNTATTAINLTGNELANYLVGNAGANTLDGGAGGVDQLWGREGDDSYFVDGERRRRRICGPWLRHRLRPLAATSCRRGIAIEVLAHDRQHRDDGDQPHRQRARQLPCRQCRREHARRRRRLRSALGSRGRRQLFRRRQRRRRRICRPGLRHRLCARQLRAGRGACRSKCWAPTTTMRPRRSTSPATNSPIT